MFNSRKVVCKEVKLKRMSSFDSCYHYKVDSAHWQTVECRDEVLKTWEAESAHNYEHNQHHVQVRRRSLHIIMSTISIMSR